MSNIQNNSHKQSFRIRSSFGYMYYVAQRNIIWKIYYYLFGAPFMSAHIIIKLIKKYYTFVPRQNILDYGCGDGIFLNHLCNEFRSTGVGVEKMLSRVDIARLVSNKFKLKSNFINSSFNNFNTRQKFDVALCLDVLEHVDNPAKEIKKIFTLLKDKGVLIIRVPYGEDKKYLLKEEVFMYGKDKHIKTGLTEIELKRFLKKCGFKVKGYIYHFYFISQIIYEILELLRRKNQILYAFVWPILFPLCLLDTFYFKCGKPNGLLVIAYKP